MSKHRNRSFPECASCKLELGKRICFFKEGAASRGCPTLTQKGILADADKAYREDPRVLEFARQASVQEGECYANRHERPYVMQPTKTRIIEICEFAKKMGYRRLGLAFCMGLRHEAVIVEQILLAHGFEVVSAVCKAGGIPKERIGIEEQEKIYQGMEESMCNPIFQAKLMNDAKTDFNVLVGLCVGHDSLFFKFAEAPTTVLAVKDRVTGHNPLAPIYLHETYYRKIRNPTTEGK